MNIRSVFIPAIMLVACALLQACEGSRYSSDVATPAPVSPGPQTLDTPQVLTAAQSTSETEEPRAVNDGLVTVAGGTDETSDPAPVTP